MTIAASSLWGGERGGIEELVTRPAWQQQADCHGMPLETFFPGQGDDLTPARVVCARCPVRVECRGFALGTEEAGGVWGGTSERERRRMRRASA